jgi:hypothetical protein
VASVGVAAVAVAAVVVVSLELGGGSSPSKAANGKPGSSNTTTSSSAPTTSSSTSTTVPSSITPVTVNASDVSYRAPATSYSITFTVSGPCWIGVEPSPDGPWVWEGTLDAGQQKVYAASGTSIIRVGAPAYLKVAVDGISVQLPASNTQPYNITFSSAP